MVKTQFNRFVAWFGRVPAESFAVVCFSVFVSIALLWLFAAPLVKQ